MLPLLTAALLAVAPAPNVERSSDFAIDLYQQLTKDPGNVFFSPYSVSQAMHLAYSGARGSTAEQMESVMRFGAEPLPDVAPGKGYDLSVANRLFAYRKLSLLPGFAKLAPIELLDFANAPEPSRRHINHWVEQQTHDRIKDLLAPSVIDPTTRLVIANAIYFKGRWQQAFDPKATRPMPFDLGAGKKVDVPMMSEQVNARYHDGPDGQIVELPYAGGNVSMVLFVPKGDLAAAKLDRRLFDGSLSSMTTARVQVYLPRFKLTGDLRLDGALQGLGMRDAFTDGADFSGIDGKRDLFISAVVHKAFVEVNEEGTEAAAATGVVMSEKAVAAFRPPVVRADHPFAFALRDNRSGALLFMGRVADPR